MLPADLVDVANIGLHPRNTGVANSAAAWAAQRALPDRMSQRWFFSGGEYNFDDTFHIVQPLWLEGIGGSWCHPRTVFNFPAGKHGLYFYYPPDSASLDAAEGAMVSNIRLQALGKTTVAHGVVMKASCFLSHSLISNFRGDGVNIVASASVSPQTIASLFRLDNVSVHHGGDSVAIASMTRNERNLAITTVSQHNFRVDDIFWLESATPNADFPRGICSVTGVGSQVTLQGLHEKDPFPGAATATDGYRVVVGHGIFTHGDDAVAGICIGCDFRNNAGWGVLEDSATGNTYIGCTTDHNDVGPIYANRSTGLGNVFISCYSESGQNPSEIGFPAILLGGNHAAGVTGSGLHVRNETATRLAFQNGGGGSVMLGDRDPNSTRYMTFNNAIDGTARHISVDFDQSILHKRMLGFGQCGNTLWPAFLITGPSSILSEWPMALDASQLVINRRFWLAMTRHETVFRRPDVETHPNDTWNQGDRAWNRDVAPGGAEGWICTRGGTLGVYSEGRTATANGTTTVVLSGPSTILKIGMYLLINGASVRIADISNATLTMVLSVPAGGPGLSIAYAPPVFNKFGSIAVQPD